MAILTLSLAGAVPALAATQTATAGVSATILGGGVEPDVPYTVTCDAGTTAFMSLELHQGNKKTGNIATGNGNRSITCTGTPQNIVTKAFTFQFAFIKGPALAHTSLSFGDGSALIFDAEVRIK